MAKGKQSRQRRSRLSLSLRFSVLVLLAALLPLALVVGVKDYFARQTLIKQSSDALSADASSNASRIDDYFRERLLDGVALSSLDTAPKFLGCVPQIAAAKQAAAQGFYVSTAILSTDCADNFESYATSVGRALVVGTKRDDNYLQWNMFLNNGQLLLSSDQATLKAGLTIPKEDLTPVQTGKQWVSAVYYDTQGKFAYVDLYTPIYQVFPDQGKVLGILGAKLKLDKVWSIVDQETKANGANNAAFITDQNGVRIADTNSADLFTAVGPLDAQAQGQIASEQLYGATTSIPVQSLPAVASAIASSEQQATFQAAAPGEAQYQFVGEKLQTLPWMYFVASPITSITAVAVQQERLSIISAAIVAVLAMLIGLFIGARTARPVEQSAGDLEGAVAMLKSLAARQENSASEQHWVVDACKTGLDGVRYLADAMNQAAKRIMSASNWFNDYWDRLTEEQARATVQHLRELAAYVDEAARRQQASSDRLDKAITVTMQVSDQLLTGATEASQSAAQLEGVVRDLQYVVGGRHSAAAGISDEAAEQEAMQRRMEQVTGSIAAIRGPANMMDAASYTGNGQYAQYGGQYGGQQFNGQQNGQPVLPPPGRPVAAASARIAPRAPRQPWDAPSQMGGEDWEAILNPMGGQNGGQHGGQNGGYGANGGNGGNGSRSQMGGYDGNQW